MKQDPYRMPVLQVVASPTMLQYQPGELFPSHRTEEKLSLDSFPRQLDYESYVITMKSICTYKKAQHVIIVHSYVYIPRYGILHI